MALTKAPDPEDFFADTRMSFGDHIEDLRSHLLNAFKGFFIAFFISFFIGKFVVDFILNLQLKSSCLMMSSIVMESDLVSNIRVIIVLP